MLIICHTQTSVNIYTDSPERNHTWNTEMSVGVRDNMNATSHGLISTNTRIRSPCTTQPSPLKELHTLIYTVYPFVSRQLCICEACTKTTELINVKTTQQCWVGSIKVDYWMHTEHTVL